MISAGSVGKVAWLVFVVLGVTLYGYNRRDRATQFVTTDIAEQDVALLGTEGRLVGSGSTEIVLFTGYSCPFCRIMWPRLDSLLERPDVDVAVRVIHLVHPADSAAFLGAVAAECAGIQGVFREFHTAVNQSWRSSGPLGESDLSAVARQIAVPDAGAFDSCLSSRETGPTVFDGYRAGDRLQIPGVPALILGSTLIVGSPTIPQLLDLRLKYDPTH